MDLVVEKLSTIAPEGSAEAALAELAKIGNTNPIMALVQISSTFSKEALENVINKMVELKESIAASLEDDKVNEQNAIADFRSLLGEIELTRKSVA